MGLIREGKGERDSKEERERARKREGGGGLIGANEQSKQKSPPCIAAPLHSPRSSPHTNIRARTSHVCPPVHGRKQPFPPHINIKTNKQRVATLPAASHLFLCSLCHVMSVCHTRAQAHVMPQSAYLHSVISVLPSALLLERYAVALTRHARARRTFHICSSLREVRRSLLSTSLRRR